MLPPELHGLVTSGALCHDCLVYMHKLSTNAARGVFGPLPMDVSPQLNSMMVEMELLRIEAARQHPHPTDP